jgi:nitroreductase
MDVFEAIRTLRAVRQYQEKPVPDEVVRRIVEAGRLTASSGNRQPWHFIVVQNHDTLRQLGGMLRSGPYVAQAPLAIAVAIEQASRFGVSDASRAIQSMMLTAWEAGVGSNWVGFGPLTEVSNLLNVPPDLEVLAVVPFGYPVESPRRGKTERKPLGTIAHRERFGQPFE